MKIKRQFISVLTFLIMFDEIEVKLVFETAKLERISLTTIND